MAITPVIMSGGAGTRLWPVSRADAPKPLRPLAGLPPLLLETLDRLGPGDGLFAPPVIICNAAHAAAVRELCAGREPPPRLLLEPVGRNTAACAAAAAALAVREGEPERLILLCPADHHMDDAQAFRDVVAAAAEAAAAGRIVTFGVTPDAPETGYGYIRAGEPISGSVRAVSAFVEKPDQATARAYVAGGEHLWNAGYFLFRADVMAGEMNRLQPAIAAAARAAIEGGRETGNGFLMEEAAFAACPVDSVDYAVMEKTPLAAVAPFTAGWTDLGAWDSVWAAAAKDAAGNALAGDVGATDAAGCLVVSEGPRIEVIGARDLVVVATADAVLVVPRDRAQAVKAVVDGLKASGRRVLT